MCSGDDFTVTYCDGIKRDIYKVTHNSVRQNHSCSCYKEQKKKKKIEGESALEWLESGSYRALDMQLFILS